MLPTSSGVAWDTIELLATKKPSDELIMVVLDFKDAFFQVPVLPEERPFLAAKLRGKCVVFERAAQGSRGASLLWRRMAALINRLTSGLSSTTKLRTSFYVDDPLIAAVGTAAETKRSITKVVASWMGLGFRLAFEKRRMRNFFRISRGLRQFFKVAHDGVTASVKKAIVEEVRGRSSASSFS